VTSGVGNFLQLRCRSGGWVRQIGEQHLTRYATEFGFRRNHPKPNDAERGDILHKKNYGKRLKYRGSKGVAESKTDRISA
jgi:hypothetical protein